MENMEYVAYMEHAFYRRETSFLSWKRVLANLDLRHRLEVLSESGPVIHLPYQPIIHTVH